MKNIALLRFQNKDLFMCNLACQLSFYKLFKLHAFLKRFDIFFAFCVANIFAALDDFTKSIKLFIEGAKRYLLDLFLKQKSNFILSYIFSR